MSISDEFLTGDPERDATRVAYLFLITAISILAVIVAVGYYLVPNENVRQVLIVLDTLYSGLLLLDFLLRMRIVADKKAYFLRGGWLDLLGSIPGFPFLRLMRVFRISRNVREILAQTPQEVAEMAREKLGTSVLFITSFIVLVVVTVGSIGVVLVEAPVAGSNIKTGYDATWWSLVTIATVGYGDRYPVTGMGRIIGTFMIVVGVALFTTLTSYLASTLSDRAASMERQRQLEAIKQNADRIDFMMDRILNLQEQLAKSAGLDVPEDKPPQEQDAE